MANTKNSSISRDKVLSVIGLIAFILLFIFCCLSNSIIIGKKLLGTFGILVYPILLVLSFVCLIKFLGFSYKRSAKATILMICFIYCFCAVIHCIKTFSTLDAIVSKETFIKYLELSYSKNTLLGSLGCLLSGSISYFLGGVGSIIVFVIAGTLFIGFFIDYELYGKYEEKHIKQLKSSKLRKKVMHSDDKLDQNGTPKYSFSTEPLNYTNEDVAHEISATEEDLSSSGNEKKYYTQSDVAHEISDNGYYGDSLDSQNGSAGYGLGGYNYQQNKPAESQFYGNTNLFGRDAVTEQENKFSNNFYSEPDYPDVYEENEQRRQFMRDTFDMSNSSSNSEPAPFTSFNVTNNNDYSYGQNNTGNDFGNNDSYGSVNYFGGESDNQFSTDSSNFNQDNVDTYNYGGVYNFPDSEPYVGVSSDSNLSNDYNIKNEDNNNGSSYNTYNEFSNNTNSSLSSNNFSNASIEDNNVSSSFNIGGQDSFNVEDKINNIISGESFETANNNSSFDFNSNSDSVSNLVKDDINNFSFSNDNSKTNFESHSSFDFLTESMKEIADDSGDFGGSSSFAKSNVVEKNDSLNMGGSEKVKIPSQQKPDKKPFPGYNRSVKYNAPPLDLLRKPVLDTGSYDEEQQRKAKGLEKALNAFNIPVTVANIVRGPKITRYELSVPLGVSIKKIPNYELDIKKTLATKTVNIQAPIPGSEFVGVELENDTFTNVYLRELFESDNFKNCTDPLPIVIGKDISGEIVVKSLTKMVHLLIAGQTGSGKSVFVHTTILSLIQKYSPDDLRLVLIDPKRVEFNRYNGLPHLMTPEVVLGTEKSINALKWCVSEMDRRYELMSKSGYNHILSYNNSELVKSGQMPKFPYIVIIVDEFAEVIMANKKETDNCIQRITQLARACGMHLILATQRPSVDVISGVIKNNVPSRVAFSLASSFDSKTIIGTVGAENLLGEGDMLFSPNGTSVIQRLQAAYCTDDEIQKFIDYDIAHNEQNFDEAVAHMIEEPTGSGQDGYGGFSSDDAPQPKELDEYLKVALKMFIQKGVASGSYIQRRLQIGYSRAARIMDQLEDKGYIAPANGSKVRKVLITADQFKQEFHEDIDMGDSDD